MQLQNLIRSYLDKHPSLTLNALALRSDVSATTLRRIMSKESNNPPSANNVLNIVSYIYKERRVGKLLNMLDGDILTYLKQCFSSYVFESESVEHNIEINKLLKDRENYLIYKLASNESGVTLNEITHLFGHIGKQKLLSLVSAEVLQEVSTNIYKTKCQNFSLDIPTALEHLPALIQFFKPEDAAKGNNLFYSLSESLTPEAVSQVVAIQMEAVKKINEVMSEPKNFGTTPFFWFSIADSLTLNNNNEVLQ